MQKNITSIISHTSLIDLFTSITLPIILIITTFPIKFLLICINSVTNSNHNKYTNTKYFFTFFFICVVNEWSQHWMQSWATDLHIHDSQDPRWRNLKGDVKNVNTCKFVQTLNAVDLLFNNLCCKGCLMKNNQYSN